MQILNAACCWGQINQSLFHSEVERLPEDARALPPTLKCSYFSLKMIFFHIVFFYFYNFEVVRSSKNHLDQTKPVELGHEVGFQLVHAPPLLRLGGGLQACGLGEYLLGLL